MEIIAEIGQNHNGDMGLAKELIQAASENGADAAKFQLYDARALFPKEGNPWYDYNLRTELSRDDVVFLAEACAGAGIEFISSVFDPERVAWLEEVGVARHKIASRSIGDAALIKAAAATGKPLLVSLGMWEGSGLPEIDAPGGALFFHCVSKYPTPLEDVRLTGVDFAGAYAGFSDHTVGISAAVAAFARGAGIVEKHFTLDKSMYGPDHVCSMDPTELRALSGFRNDFRRCL